MDGAGESSQFAIASAVAPSLVASTSAGLRSRSASRRPTTPGAWIEEASDDEAPTADVKATLAPAATERHASTVVATQIFEDTWRADEEVAVTSAEKGKAKATDDEDSPWTCHICLLEASDPITTLCGHLLCWECISRWWESKPDTPPSCPVCKSRSGPDKVIPIYGRGRDEVDPRRKPTAPRPRANAPPPVPTAPAARLAPFFGGGPFTPASPTQGGFQVQAGLFPIPGFGFTWTSGGTRQPTRPGEAVEPPIAPPNPALQIFAILFMTWLFMGILLN